MAKDKDKMKLRDYPTPKVWWPNLEGTVSAETAKKMGIKVPKRLQGNVRLRIRIIVV